MKEISISGYEKQQVLDVLQAKNGIRKTMFRYFLLDSKDNEKWELEDIVLTGSIKYIADADIKATANFSMKDDNSIDFFKDRIQPWQYIKVNGEWIGWSLGIYLLNSPTKNYNHGGTYREIEAYDKVQTLSDSKLSSRLLLKAGWNYTDEIAKVILSAGEKKINIVHSNLNLTIDKEFEIGTSKLEIINTLLAELNYHPIRANESGYFVSTPYISPSEKDIEYTFENGKADIVFDDMNDEIDYFNIANEFVVYSSNPDAPSLRSVYINDNPLSDTSTISRGRKITDVFQIDNIADQTTLNEYTKKRALEESNIDNIIRFNSISLPIFTFKDMLKIEHNDIGKSELLEWNYNLEAGARMQLKARKVVEI